MRRPEGKCLLNDLDLDGKLILKSIANKHNGCDWSNLA